MGGLRISVRAMDAGRCGRWLSPRRTGVFPKRFSLTFSIIIRILQTMFPAADHDIVAGDRLSSEQAGKYEKICVGYDEKEAHLEKRRPKL
jgi:hypothetical protein